MATYLCVNGNGDLTNELVLRSSGMIQKLRVLRTLVTA